MGLGEGFTENVPFPTGPERVRRTSTGRKQKVCALETQRYSCTRHRMELVRERRETPLRLCLYNSKHTFWQRINGSSWITCFIQIQAKKIKNWSWVSVPNHFTRKMVLIVRRSPKDKKRIFCSCIPLTKKYLGCIWILWLLHWMKSLITEMENIPLEIVLWQSRQRPCPYAFRHGVPQHNRNLTAQLGFLLQNGSYPVSWMCPVRLGFSLSEVSNSVTCPRTEQHPFFKKKKNMILFIPFIYREMGGRGGGEGERERIKQTLHWV